ncbi:MAG: ABC transporter permease [Bacteroidales bacterium]|nr:ABC transporter permease [Bacteroidales bacterium]MDD4670336.1 ABC transporter permease [Bacteroidales bacterium]
MKGLKVVSPLFRENFNVAMNSIRNNRLRSILTITIIAIGITSLVGIQTAIEVLSNSVSESYGRMGASAFSINAEYYGQSVQHKRGINRRQLTYEQVTRFVKEFDVPCVKSIHANAFSGYTEVKSGSLKTDPNIVVIAANENYILYRMGDIDLGRNFNSSDMDNGSYVCMIGENIRKVLFPNEAPIDKIITIGSVRYKVIGTIKPQGNTFDTSLDDMVVIPYTNARYIFLSNDTYYNIGIVPGANQDREVIMEKAKSLFRVIRRLGPRDADDFRIFSSDAMEQDLNDMKAKLSSAALVIGLITLLGAAIGLMNIMLVSVKERTKEIGTRKTLGATSKTIEQQFFMEAIVIGQIGGFFGIILGIIVGNIVAISMKASFAVPWKWLIISVVICLVVSVLSGYMPARRAAALNPIDALRYE